MNFDNNLQYREAEKRAISTRRSALKYVGASAGLAGMGKLSAEPTKVTEKLVSLYGRTPAQSLGLEENRYSLFRSATPEEKKKVETKSEFEFQPEEEGYADFIAGLNLRYIKPHEVIRAHRRERNGVKNGVPPRRLWKKMAPTLKVADELRDRLGVPLTYITSAYRCPAYNRQCPGAASRSYHTRNQATDLIFACTPREAFLEAREMRKEGVFKGGLGLYKGFLHVDTRGYNATWGA